MLPTTRGDVVRKCFAAQRADNGRANQRNPSPLSSTIFHERYEFDDRRAFVLTKNSMTYLLRKFLASLPYMLDEKNLALFTTQDHTLVGAFSILGQAKYAVNAINLFTGA
jgi:hypothetical protein